MKINAVIIAKNEEELLEECILSLKWVDEILLVDTGSTDNTVKIANKLKCRVVNYKTGKHFSDWRNKGMKESKGEWVLYVDADERVPKELKKEIESIISSQKALNAYAIPRRNFMFGQEMKHISVPPDYQKRLFKKSEFVKWTGEVHEEPIFRGKLGHMKAALLHYKHETFTQMVEKTNKWSSIEAKLMYEAGHPAMNIPRFASAMVREFWQRMIVHKAFLDGKIGIIYALYQVFSRFTSYAKLWEMQITKTEK